MKSEKSTSESRKSRPLEVGKTDPNYTNNNYTENNYNNLIYPSEQLKGQEADDGSDGMEQVIAYKVNNQVSIDFNCIRSRILQILMFLVFFSVKLFQGIVTPPVDKD